MKMKWISELNLTQPEKAVLVAIMCFQDIDIAPTMENIGNFSVDFSKEVLRRGYTLPFLLSLSRPIQDAAATLYEKIFGYRSEANQ